MSFHVSLGAWEVKGSGAVWISDAHHRALIELAEATGADLVLRLRDPRLDSAYAAYEVNALRTQLERLAALDPAAADRTALPTLLPSAHSLDELLVGLLELTRRALEWRTEIIVRADGAARSAR